MTEPNIRAGQIWRDADQRKVRYIKIITAGETYITLRTCNQDGEFTPRSVVSQALRSRFGRSRGYIYHRETA